HIAPEANVPFAVRLQLGVHSIDIRIACGELEGAVSGLLDRAATNVNRLGWRFSRKEADTADIDDIFVRLFQRLHDHRKIAGFADRDFASLASFVIVKAATRLGSGFYNLITDHDSQRTAVIVADDRV